MVSPIIVPARGSSTPSWSADSVEHVGRGLGPQTVGAADEVEVRREPETIDHAARGGGGLGGRDRELHAGAGTQGSEQLDHAGEGASEVEEVLHIMSAVAGDEALEACRALHEVPGRARQLEVLFERQTEAGQRECFVLALGRRRHGGERGA